MPGVHYNDQRDGYEKNFFWSVDIAKLLHSLEIIIAQIVTPIPFLPNLIADYSPSWVPGVIAHIFYNSIMIKRPQYWLSVIHAVGAIRATRPVARAA